MKKTITLLLVTLSLSAAAQTKQQPKPEQAKDTLTVDISKVRYIKLGEQLHDLQSEIPLFLQFNWIIQAYSFFDEAKSGLSKKEIETLQQPLLPYWQYYQKQLQQQKK